MANYTFESLSPLEFEHLVRDLISEERHLRFCSFKSGRDKGIDLRYTESDGRQHQIAQAKHYVGSGVPKLVSDLKKEASKVAALNPSHYILATSLGLTPDNQSNIASIFAPYAKSVSVYGRDDLNQLIDTVGAEIEKRHYKLWLTSVNVMQKVLNSKILTLTDYTLHAVRRRLCRYVQSQGFSDALRILEDSNVLIISGPPGIGKTTLAEALLAHYVDEGYQPIKVSASIDEAIQMDTPEVSQIFYYDDFLGRATLSSLNKNEDQTILEFIMRIQSQGRNRLIMTTREYILQDAEQKYERIADSDISTKKYILDAGKYTERDKAHILFNHLYFSDLAQEHVFSIAASEILPDIVSHKNYNPRVIEAMTKEKVAIDIKPSDYPQKFLEALNNPTFLYEHIFDNQFGDNERAILYVLCSLGSKVEENNLKRAFACFLEGKPDARVTTKLDLMFIKSLKLLDGTFTSSERGGSVTYVTFHNPSVEEFIYRKVVNSELVCSEILVTACFFDQCFLSRYSHGDSRIILLAESKVLVEALERTLGNELGRLYNSAPWSKETAMTRVPESYERQVLRALNQLGYRNDSNVNACRTKLAEHLVERLRDGSCACSDICATLDLIRSTLGESSEVSREALARSVNIFAQRAHIRNDGPSLVEFIQKFPHALSQYEKDELNDKLCSFSEDLTRYQARERSIYQWQEDMKIVGQLSTLLGAELEDWVTDIQGKIREINEEVGHYEDDEEWREYAEGDDDESDDLDLKSMFEPLVDGFRGTY